MKQLIILLFILIFSFSINAQKVENKTFVCGLYINEQAEFKGGMTELKKFIDKNLQYPKTNACVCGKVYIQFIVEKDGRITNPQIIRSLLPKEFDEEALRVIRLMPKWTPARDYGGKKPIASRFTIPIKFTIED